MASFGSLPLEVFQAIVELLTDQSAEGSLASLATTCRDFYKLVIPQLYQGAAKKHPALLFWAARFGFVSTAKRLIDDGALAGASMQWDPSQGDFEEVCYRLSRRRFYGFLRARLAARNIVISTCRKTRSKKRFWFPIHLAALGGSVEMVELLVETAPSAMTAPSFRLCGCVLEDLPRSPQEEREDYSDCCLPLHTAICHGHLDVVRWFLEHGPSLITTVAPSVTEATFKASATSNALHDAARVGRTDMIKFIWDRRSQLEFPHVDDHNDTLLSPLWLAFLSRQWDAVAVLVALGADIDDDIGYGYTPLIHACLRNNFVGVAELVDLGADVNIEFCAAPSSICHEAVIKDLAWRGARPIDLCCWTDYERNPPGFRMGLSFIEALQTGPLGHVGSWDSRGYVKNRQRRLIAVSKLLGAGADLNSGSRGHPPPLVVASANHLSGVVDELIKHGAPVNLADRKGVSPLAAAFAYPNSYCPLHAEAHLQAFNPTPFLARAKNWPETRASRLARDHGGCSELRTCADLLLANGAEANPVGMARNAPLFRLFTVSCFRLFLVGGLSDKVVWIAPSDRCRIAPLLLQHGADPNQSMTRQDMGESPVAPPPLHRNPKWPVPRYPSTAMEHAFWDSDLGACRRLLAAGAAPNEATILWMIRMVLEESSGRQRTDRHVKGALNFIAMLPAEPRCAAFRNPLCLMAALRVAWLDMAQKIWGYGPELSRFSSEKVAVDDWTSPAPAPPGALVEVGVLCLHWAARCQAGSVLEGLLELGVRPIPTSALLFSISVKDPDKGNPKILEALVKHGGTIHIRDDMSEGDGNPPRHPTWQAVFGCISPMKLAIFTGNDEAIKTMLKWSQDPVDPWLRYHYLRDACAALRPDTLACLLAHPSMHFTEADVTDETDLPLTHLVRHVEKICKNYPRRHPARGSGPESTAWALPTWMRCVGAFAHAGADPTVKDRAGKSALDYLGEQLGYEGKNRFRRSVRDQWLELVGSVGRRPDPADCYAASKSTPILPR